MEEIAAARLGRPQKVGGFTFPLRVIQNQNRVSQSLFEVMNKGIDWEVYQSIIRTIPSNAGAALTSGDNYCHWSWTGSGVINTETAEEVLVIELYLDELWANYLQLTDEGPLGSGNRHERKMVKGDHRELAKVIGKMHRVSSYEVSAVVISGDLSAQEVEYIRSNISQEVPSLTDKFKAPYAGPEYVNAIGAACWAQQMAAYDKRIHSGYSWHNHDEM